MKNQTSKIMIVQGLLSKAIPAGFVYVAMDGDNAGNQVEIATLKDDVNATEDISNRIRAASEAVKTEAEKHGAKVIVFGGDNLGFLLPEAQVNIVENLRKLYLENSKFTVTAGIGDSIPKATEALLYGKLHGKDQLVNWTSEIETYMKNATKETEADKVKHILVSSLEKAEGTRGGNIVGHTKSGKPIYMDATHSEHSSFNEQDHNDAIQAHETAAKTALPASQRAHKEAISVHFRHSQNQAALGMQQHLDTHGGQAKVNEHPTGFSMDKGMKSKEIINILKSLV